MTRPKKNRRVEVPPKYGVYKPVMVPINQLEMVNLTIDEYEAIRLADLEGLDQKDAAEKMGISRPTFTRLVEQARFKIADFLINGKFLQIEGGTFHFMSNLIRCGDCGKEFELDIQTDTFTACPNCGSSNLINLAQKYGHGRCCRGFGKGGRRGQKGNR